MLPPELILQLVKKLQRLHMTDVPGHISHGQSAVPSALETSVACFILQPALSSLPSEVSLILTKRSASSTAQGQKSVHAVIITHAEAFGAQLERCTCCKT